MKRCDSKSGNAVAIVTLPVFACWSLTVIVVIISKFIKRYFRAKLFHKHCIVFRGLSSDTRGRAKSGCEETRERKSQRS